MQGGNPWYDDLLDRAVNERLKALDHNSVLKGRLHKLVERVGKLGDPGAIDEWSELIELLVDLTWGFTRLYIQHMMNDIGFTIDSKGDVWLLIGNDAAIVLRNAGNDDEFAEVVKGRKPVEGAFNAETQSFE